MILAGEVTQPPGILAFGVAQTGSWPLRQAGIFSLVIPAKAGIQSRSIPQPTSLSCSWPSNGPGDFCGVTSHQNRSPGARAAEAAAALRALLAAEPRSRHFHAPVAQACRPWLRPFGLTLLSPVLGARYGVGKSLSQPSLRLLKYSRVAGSYSSQIISIDRTNIHSLAGYHFLCHGEGTQLGHYG